MHAPPPAAATQFVCAFVHPSYTRACPPPRRPLGNFGSPTPASSSHPSLHLIRTSRTHTHKMAKHAANKGKTPLTDKNNKRKRDAQDNKHEDAPVALFAAVKDTELDDIFAKSVSVHRPWPFSFPFFFFFGKTFDAHVSTFQDAFSAPVPVASTSKAHLQTTSEPAAKKGKKSPSPKVQVEEDVEVDDQSESNSAEEEDEDEDENENEDGEDNDAELSEIDEELPDEDDEEASDAGSDDEAAKAKETKKAKKAKLGKYVPAEESVQDKNRRTAFIGNLPIDAAKSKVRESILFTPPFYVVRQTDN